MLKHVSGTGALYKFDAFDNDRTFVFQFGVSQQSEYVSLSGAVCRPQKNTAPGLLNLLPVIGPFLTFSASQAMLRYVFLLTAPPIIL